jgi:ABC-type amino acid transport substrate-binding protein
LVIGGAMTQAGAAQDGPRSLPGRILAVVWMVTIVVFIAGIASTVTMQRLQGLVRNVADLRSLRVGAVQGSSAIDFLAAQRVAHDTYSRTAEGLPALRLGQIDAFVYDRPLLGWTIRQEFAELELLPITLDSQNYAIALPPGNSTRVALDVALLETLRSEWWQQTRFRYLGRDAPP